MVLTILLHSGKSQTVKTVGVETERRAESTESVYGGETVPFDTLDDKCVSLSTGHNPRNINHQE